MFSHRINSEAFVRAMSDSGKLPQRLDSAAGASEMTDHYAAQRHVKRLIYFIR